MSERERAKRLHAAAKLILDTEVAALPGWDDAGLESQLFDLSRSPQRIHDTVHSLAILGSVFVHRGDKAAVKQLEFVTRKFAILIACAREAAKR